MNTSSKEKSSKIDFWWYSVSGKLSMKLKSWVSLLNNSILNWMKWKVHKFAILQRIKLTLTNCSTFCQKRSLILQFQALVQSGKHKINLKNPQHSQLSCIYIFFNLIGILNPTNDGIVYRPSFHPSFGQYILSNIHHVNSFRPQNVAFKSCCICA